MPLCLVHDMHAIDYPAGTIDVNYSGAIRSAVEAYFEVKIFTFMDCNCKSLYNFNNTSTIPMDYYRAKFIVSS